MTDYIVAVVAAIGLVLFIGELLRRRQLAEKYAALWLVVGVAVLLLLLVPGLLTWVTRVLGFEVAANLLFFVAVTFLIGVAIHLSWELSRLEDESRTLAEEIALLRDRVEELEGHPATKPDDRTDPCRQMPRE